MPRRIPTSYFLALAAAVVTGVTVSFAAFTSYTARERVLEEASREGQLLAASMNGHLTATLRDVSNSLHASSAFIRAEGGYGYLRSVEVHQALAREVLDNAVISALLAVDESGHVVASSSRIYEPGDFLLTNSETLAYFRGNPLERGVRIGRPRRGLEGDEWVLPISKAVYNDAGKFEGLIMALVDLRNLRSYYRSLPTRPYTVLSMLTEGGTLITRVPHVDALVGEDLSKSSMPVGTFGSDGTFDIGTKVAKDGRTKLAAYRRVPGYPLIVAAGIDKTQVLQQWHAATRSVLVFSAAGLLFFWMLCGALFVWLRRLRAGEERFQLAAKGWREGVFDYIAESRRFFQSRQLGVLLGQRTPASPTLESFLAVLAPAERRRVLRLFLREVRRKEGFRFDVNVDRPLGGLGVLFVSGQVVKDREGKLKRVCGVVCDITDLRRAEAEARRFAGRYAVIFEQANDGIALFKDGRIVDANPKLLRMLRVARAEDLVGRDAWVMAPRLQPDGKLSREVALSHMEDALTGAAVWFTWRMRRADGREFAANLSLALVAVDGAPQLLAHIRDVRHMVVDDAVTEPGSLYQFAA